LALSGGVGGAKLALGLERVLPAGELAVLVNTGDDFTHLGLRICPDLDTLLYTLGGVVHTGQGWGRADESFGFMEELRRQGGPDWFLLGDRDLVLHVERTRRLAAGERLTVLMAEFAQRFGVRSRLLRRPGNSSFSITSCGCAAPLRCAPCALPAPLRRGPPTNC
jgi:LPPG:FO 2-phospho-L-lactate transferase